MDLGPQLIKFRFCEQMITRGRDTTFTREADHHVKQESDGWSFRALSKVGRDRGCRQGDLGLEEVYAW